jgi:hypothetical protein
MLQAERSRVRFLMRSLDLFNSPNPSRCIMALVSTWPLIEISTRNLHGGKGWPASKTDLTGTYGPPRPVIGIDFSNI